LNKEKYSEAIKVFEKIAKSNRRPIECLASLETLKMLKLKDANSTTFKRAICKSENVKLNEVSETAQNQQQAVRF
jgi:hypothetical protein